MWNDSFQKHESVLQNTRKCETVLSKNTNIFQKHKYFPKTQIMWNGSFQKHESVLQKIVKPITDIVGFT